MNDFLSKIIDAHGGLIRWDRFSSVSATIVTGGGLWALKGLVQDPSPRQMKVWLHEQRASVAPFGRPEWHTAFTADRIAIVASSGETVRERSDPRSAFAGHVMNTPWDALDRAYFNGYAMWTYLTTPFFMAMPVSRSARSPRGKKAASGGAGYEFGFPMPSRAIARSRTSISATTGCSAVTIIGSISPAAFRLPNTFTTSWKRRGCAFPRSAAPMFADRTDSRCATC